MSAPIAITGATGFVGRRLVRALLRRGRQVRALVRDQARAGDLDRYGARIVQGDLDDREALHRLIAGCAGVIHTAGLIAAPDAADFHHVNVTGSANIATAANDAGVGRFVQVSSLAAREPALSPYGASKRAGEDAVRSILPDAATTIIRPPAVYGPGDRATLPLVTQLASRYGMVPGHRRQRLSVIYVDCLAEALAEAVCSPAADPEPIEIDDGRKDGYAWHDLAREASLALDRPTRLFLLPRPVTAAAATLLTAWARSQHTLPVLGRDKVAELYHDDWVARRRPTAALARWQPKCRFRDGFSRTVQWYVDNGWLPATTGPATPHRSDEPEELHS